MIKIGLRHYVSDIYFSVGVTKQEIRLEMLCEFKNFINLVYYNLKNSSYLPISMEDFRLLPNHEDLGNLVSLEMVNEQTFSIREKLPNNLNGSRFMEFQPKMIDNELKDLETRNLKLIENWQVSGTVSRMPYTGIRVVGKF